MKKELTEDQLKDLERWAGKIEVVDGQLHFSRGYHNRLTFNLPDIKVIGEFTTNADPVIVDWYLILVTNENKVYYIPAYALGFQEAMKNLSEALGVEITPLLFTGIRFDSNILFPGALKGEKLFHFEGLNPPGIWNKLKTKLGFQPITPVLRQEIAEFKP